MTVPRVSAVTRVDCNRNLLEETGKPKLSLVCHPTLTLQFLKIFFSFSACVVEMRTVLVNSRLSTQSMCHFLFLPVGTAVYFKEKMMTTAQRLVDYYQWVIENGGKYTELLHPYLSHTSLEAKLSKWEKFARRLFQSRLIDLSVDPFLPFRIKLHYTSLVGRSIENSRIGVIQIQSIDRSKMGS